MKTYRHAFDHYRKKVVAMSDTNKQNRPEPQGGENADADLSQPKQNEKYGLGSQDNDMQQMVSSGNEATPGKEDENTDEQKEQHGRKKGEDNY